MKQKTGQDTAVQPAKGSVMSPPPPDTADSRKQPWSTPSIRELSLTGRTGNAREPATIAFETHYYTVPS